MTKPENQNKPSNNIHMSELCNSKQKQMEKALKTSQKDKVIHRAVAALCSSKLEYLRQIYQNPDITSIEEFQDITREKFFYNEVFPAHFYGNLNLERPVVSISLNPKWDNGKAQEQGNDFEEWINKCMNGFLNYLTDKDMHSVWKNLVKVIASLEERKNRSSRMILSENVINLDWCFYYSRNFPTLKGNHFDLQLCRDYDANLREMLSWLKPKAIFIHGKSFERWFERCCSNKLEEMTLKHGEQKYKVHSGLFLDTKIPVIYQEWFINRGNKTENLDKVRRLLYSKM